MQPLSHKKFTGTWCCRIAVALEEHYFLVDATGMVDCFGSYEEAFSAGSRALLTIINKRIILPRKSAPKASEVVPSIMRSDAPEIVFGLFESYD